MSENTQLLHSPLDAFHRDRGARMTEFAGWEMPVQFTGIVDEHLAVRRLVGLFDISHMGQIQVSGKKALSDLQRIVTKDISRAASGRAVYSLLCDPEGGILDDIIVYKMADDRFFIIVNAVNSDKDFEWIRGNVSKKTRAENLSQSRALFALQGPKSAAILEPLVRQPLADLFYFRFREDTVADTPVILARTGYTGEDGFEISVASDRALDLWNSLHQAGKPSGMKSVGLGARDTLRLEMAYSLYGHEISESVSPFEANLQKAVSLNKSDFIGREAIVRRAEESRRTLVGLEMLERGIPRPHFFIKSDSTVVGTVTSGTMSPSLGRGIALAFVQKEFSEVGTILDVDIRGRKCAAVVVRTPFCTPRTYRSPRPVPKKAGAADSDTVATT